MQLLELNYPQTTIKACLAAIKKGLSPFLRPEPLSLSKWATENFYLSAESSYVQGNWTAIPWQVAIMDCISHDDIKEINWIKSARVGATKIMLAGVAYFAAHKPRNQIFYQPTDGDSKEFVKTEIDTMIRDCHAVQKVFPSYGNKGPGNTDALKMFTGCKLNLKGGKAAKNYRRLSSDVNWYDELEAFDHDVEGEGDPLTLGDKRLEGSFYPKSVRATTPKFAHNSLIEKAVQGSDYYFKYQLPCPHCKEHQVLEWGGPDLGYGFTWTDNNPNTAAYSCKHCQCTIENEALPDMLEAGYWQTECGVKIITGDVLEFIDATGQALETPRSVGFHIWTAYSPFVAWAEIVRGFIKANTAAKNGDLTKLKTWINTTKGETWKEDSEGETVDYDLLHKRREHYPRKDKKLLVPNRGLTLMGGWDMQDDRVEGETRAYGLDGENYLIDYFVLYGNPAQPFLWEQLKARVTKTYTREDGTIMPITRICFDSGGHFTDAVYSFCKPWPNQKVIPSKGSSEYDKPIATLPPKKNDKGVRLLKIGTDTAKDIIYNWLSIESNNPDEPVPGYCHHPIAEFTHEAYFKQLCAEERIEKLHRGRKRFIYDAKGRRNEALDCFVGSLAAFQVSKQHFGLNMEVLAAGNQGGTNLLADIAKRLGS